MTTELTFNTHPLKSDISWGVCFLIFLQTILGSIGKRYVVNQLSAFEFSTRKRSLPNIQNKGSAFIFSSIRVWIMDHESTL